MITRRDFLKLASTLPPILPFPQSILQQPNSQAAAPNILVLVFDAWSAHNISLYGYPRQTTPHLEQLAEKAIVYHNHYAGGHFTVPGTASLLTGTLPWRHSIHHMAFPIAEEYLVNNIFGLLPEYNRFAYTHNLWAENVLNRMKNTIDNLKPSYELYYWSAPVLKQFFEDSDIATLSWIKTNEVLETGSANSLFFSRIWSRISERSRQQLAETYPLGLPEFGASFSLILEDAIDWLIEQQADQTSPNLTYCHLFPPHDPYNTRIDFYQRFAGDGYSPVSKSRHVLSNGISDQENKARRDAYDEFILLVDSDFNRLYQQLEAQGTLDNTWLVLTSDHGEIFERGLLAHTKPAFFEPLAKVPLLIFPPGLQERIDIHAPTSATDILATLLAIAGKPIPAAIEGQLLPPFNQDYDPNRPIFQIDAQFTGYNTPDPSGSIMVRKGSHKLICHFGDEKFYQPLQGIPVFELYDLARDPEELTNLFTAEPEVSADLLGEIDAKLASEGIELQIRKMADF